MPLFFVTIDVERALGLENIIPNFHIICLDASERVNYLRDSGIKVFCLEEHEPSFNPKLKSTNQVLSHPLVISYIKQFAEGQKANIMVFKTNEGIEQIAAENNFAILEVPSHLNKLFEDKVSQYETLNAAIDKPKLPKIITTHRLGEVDWDDTVKKCESNELVLQFSRGNSGKTTYFLKEKQEFENLKNLYPLRMAKISEKISGKPYTINACVTKYGVLCGGLNEQITGISILTTSEGGTCGNDWTQIGLLDEQRKSIIEMTVKTGKIMEDHGFKGMFGIDFMVGQKGTYLIEINARQIASIPMHTKLQLKNNELPLQLAHILELSNSWDDYKKFNLPENIQNQIEEFKKAILYDINQKNNQPISASQITLRNINEQALTINGQFTTGIYKYGGDNTGRIGQDKQDVLKVVNIDELGDKTLCMIKKGYDISSLSDMEGFLITTLNKGKVINPMMEYGRMQFPFSVLEDNGNLRGWIVESINTVKRHVLK